MKVLITGANGMVARATAEHCRGRGDDVFALARQELNISDMNAVLSRIAELEPDAVINCAAYTNVDGAESNVEGCYAANARGVENLAVACREADAAFVTISTDYVFDGSNLGFYTQRDTPGPISVYGKAKREGEIRALAENSRSIIVRSGWIYGEGGTNFLSLMPRLLAEGKQITAIADSFGTPTSGKDLAARLRDLAAADLPGVYHVTNPGPGCSYYEFAGNICEIGGYDRSLVRPVSHADLERPAPRPVSSKLACLISEKLGFAPLRPWDEALTEYVLG